MFIIIIFTSSSEFIINSQTKNLALNVKVTKYPKLLKSTDRESIYQIDIHLINKTDSVVLFGVVSCFWQENFLSNNQCCHILGRSDCDFSSLDTMVIDPHNEISFNAGLCIDKSCVGLKRKVRVGFIFIKYSEIRTVDYESILLERRKNKSNVIWSNQIYLK